VSLRCPWRRSGLTRKDHLRDLPNAPENLRDRVGPLPVFVLAEDLAQHLGRVHPEKLADGPKATTTTVLGLLETHHALRVLPVPLPLKLHLLDLEVHAALPLALRSFPRLPLQLLAGKTCFSLGLSLQSGHLHHALGVLSIPLCGQLGLLLLEHHVLASALFAFLVPAPFLVPTTLELQLLALHALLSVQLLSFPPLTVQAFLPLALFTLHRLPLLPLHLVLATALLDLLPMALALLAHLLPAELQLGLLLLRTALEIHLLSFDLALVLFSVVTTALLGLPGLPLPAKLDFLALSRVELPVLGLLVEVQLPLPLGGLPRSLLLLREDRREGRHDELGLLLLRGHRLIGANAVGRHELLGHLLDHAGTALGSRHPLLRPLLLGVAKL
jgi:hypothetical protein